MIAERVPENKAAEIWTTQINTWLHERSAAIGFDLAGVVSVQGLDNPSEAQDAHRFESWIDAGRAGEMDYLKRRDEAGHLLRTSIKLSYPWVNSAVVCAMNYRTPGPLSIDQASSSSGWIARYAWSGSPQETDDLSAPLRPTDYHDFLLVRLQHLARDLGEHVGGTSRCYVDTGPLIERSLAARSGIGWIGKNTCVLNQEEGSWLLLGVILSSLHLPSGHAALPAPDRCGSCTRCIDACPTGALTAPHEMDASRCIAYLTIEKKGSIPTELRSSMGRQVFGCDICQDVCPWNSRSPEPGTLRIAARPELVNPDLNWLAAMDAPEFKHWFKSSPLERTRRSRLHRNVAIAMGNSGEERFLPQLRAWATGEDPILAEAAMWAIAILEREAQPLPGTDSSTRSNPSATVDSSPALPQPALC